MKVGTDGFEFDFSDALDAFVFDEKRKGTHRFHGFPMKGVDIIAEFPDSYIFIELKDIYEVADYDIIADANAENVKKSFKWLKNYLKYKFRDTLLFRIQEGKNDKKIHYICILDSFDNALNGAMKKALKSELPIKKHRLWQSPLASSCQVMNLSAWNSAFPKWTGVRVP